MSYRKFFVIFLFSFLAVALFRGSAIRSSEPAQPAASEAFRLEVVHPEKLGFDSCLTADLDAVAEEMIVQGQTPGVVIAVGRGNRIGYLKAFGQRQVEPEPLPMAIDTIFDLASVTKPVATATAIMILVQEGKIDPEKRIADYLPEFGKNGKETITVADCLTHTSGLDDNPFSLYEGTREEIWTKMAEAVPMSPRRTVCAYRCANFITLGFLIEKVSGKSLRDFTAEKIYRPLGMADTSFCPDEARKKLAVTTEYREERGRWLKGEVHDPAAWGLGGISGNAGLFSTASDLAVFASMMIGRGTLHRPDGTSIQILRPETFDLMTAPRKVPTGIRAYGWDKRSPLSGNRAWDYSDSSFGHSGFTGTSIWIDPENDLFVILLGNRLHPKIQENKMNRRAAQVGQIALERILRPASPQDER